MHRSSSAIALLSALSLFFAMSIPGTAAAGGFELPGEGGARGLGRGGAFYARADDPMALIQNPANLADMTGVQILLTGGFNTFDACYQRTSAPDNNYSDTDFPLGFASPSIFDVDPTTPPFATYASSPYPRSCNESSFGPALNLAASFRLTPGIGIGVGIMTPQGVGSSRWAADGDRFTAPGGPAGILPPPGRYNLLTQDQLILYPSVGIGIRPNRWFRFGATFQWGVGVFDFTTMTVPNPGQDPAFDVRADLHAVDPFIPGVIFSAHFVPHDNLDVMLGLKMLGDLEASGQATLTTGWYGAGQEDGSVAGAVPLRNPPIDGASLSAGQPWELRLGLRYAHRITPRPDDASEIERLSGRTEDAMSNEWFDIELDAIYLINRTGDLTVGLPPGSETTLREIQPSGIPFEQTLPLPERFILPHQWNDQWLLRLGGDFNAIPGLATLRAGFSFESSAYDSTGVFSNRDSKRYVGLDFIPGMRFGLHLGLTVRISMMDVSLAYAHIFQQTIDVSPAEAGARQLSANRTDEGEIVNAGSYSADYDMLHLAVNLRL